MLKSSNVNVRVSGMLREHLNGQIGHTGAYENASEYVRDLIRKDLQNKRDAWRWLADELAPAMQADAKEYKRVSAQDVIARNSKPRKSST